jgi:DNA-binding LacI/PurR family transcriptional regulator
MNHGEITAIANTAKVTPMVLWRYINRKRSCRDVTQAKVLVAAFKAHGHTVTALDFMDTRSTKSGLFSQLSTG